ncbi:MAG: hypothetical protein KF862_14910 [Chitinophagaceae bacterium]|nr:hypothetical protein [Chitinophagaceae bacterium]
MKHTALSRLCMILFMSISILSCKKDKEPTSAALIKQYALAGTYKAQITPSFMGTSAIASGEHTVRIEDLGDGRIRLLYDKFQKNPMPFVMTADITMTVKKGNNNTLLLEGKDGLFKADPPDGSGINPDDIMPGIQLPDGAENGMRSDQAGITGTYGEIEKEGVTANRFDLNLTPGLPLPVQVFIYTKQKIN